MEKITILGLLLKYEKWLDKGEIQFLGKGTEGRKIVLSMVKDLISDFKKAAEKGGDLSSNLDWHATHKKGRDLWHELASHSLNHINTIDRIFAHSRAICEERQIYSRQDRS